MKNALFSLSAVLMLLVSVVGCQTDEELPVPVLTLTTESIDVSAEGGSYEIQLQSNNFEEWGFSAVPEWITDISLNAGKSTLQMTVLKNEEATPREATIEIRNQDARAETVKLAVRQAAAERDFEFQIDKVYESYVTFSIFPKDKEMDYLYMITDNARFQQFGNEAAILEWTKTELEKLAELHMTSYENYLQEYKLLRGDKLNILEIGLKEDTEYVVFCYGLENGEKTTEIVSHPFRTEKLQKVDCSFTIDVTTDKNTVDMKVTPSDNDVYYYRDVMSVFDYENYFGGKMPDAAQLYLNELISIYGMLGFGIEETMNKIKVKGETALHVADLKANADHIAFAVAITDGGIICSDVTTFEFKTGSTDSSDNQIEIAIKKVTSDAVTLEAVPSNDDPYILTAELASSYEGMSDDEIVAAMITTWGAFLDYMTIQGKQEQTIEYLIPDTDYLAVAFGYQNGGATTKPTIIPFRTLKAE